MKFNIIILILLYLILNGCSNGDSDLAGSGSNTGNAFVVGIAQHESLQPENVQVALIPLDDSEEEIQYTTVNSNGEFSFPAVKNRRYSVQIDDTISEIGALEYGFTVFSDTARVNKELKNYGSVRLVYNDSVAAIGSVKIPGTLIKHVLPASQSRSSETDTTGVLLTRFPEADYVGFCVETDNHKDSTVTYPFTVQAAQTVKVTTFSPVEADTSFVKGLPSRGILSLSMDSDNRLLVGTDNGYVGIYDENEGWDYIDIHAYGVKSGVVALSYDQQNDLWCGTLEGVLHFDKNLAATHYHSGNSELPGDAIRSIAIDSSGNKWFTTVDGGIACKTSDGWKTFNPDNSDLPSNNVFQVQADKEYVWTITDQGIAQYITDGYSDSWYVYDKRNSPFTSDSMTAMAISGDERWFAAWDGSVYHQVTGWWDRFDEDNSPITRHPIMALHLDREGTLWAANTNSELFAYNNGNWVTFNPGNSTIPENCGMILSIVEQDEGDIFIATEKQGVIQLHSKN